MKRVAASEYDLLTIARAIVGQVPVDLVEPLLRQSRQQPSRCGPTSLELVKQTLSRGVVLQLARRGGAFRDRYLIAGEAVEGRVWQRYSELPLHFSTRSMRLLRWLTFDPVGEKTRSLGRNRPTLGDQILLYLTADLLERAGLGRVIGQQSGFEQPLVWLGFADWLYGETPPKIRAGDFRPLLEQPAILECLQPDFSRRWLEMERTKRHFREPAQLTQFGQSQEAVLSAYLDAIDGEGRRDLAFFLMDATSRLFDVEPDQRHWVGGLDPHTSLQARSQARRAAGAMVSAINRLAVWHREHQATRFFDDEYPAAQLLLSQWENLGELRLARARELVRQLESLATAVEA
ncbi:MAG: hypothetical protein HN348_02930 [Proteobacteria bacterium]|jgi:hypothetical protein|nr:hypothetical protein [Pseudomonadota bacterium]